MNTVNEIKFSGPAEYIISIQGNLPESLASNLGGLTSISVNEADKYITTSIRVKIKDQAELSAVMNTLYEWRYTILLVKCEGSTLNS